MYIVHTPKQKAYSVLSVSGIAYFSCCTYLAVALEIPKLAAELTLRAAKLWVVIFVKITDGKILAFYDPCTQNIKWSSNLHHPRSKEGD